MEIPIKINLLKLDMFITLMIMRDVNNGWAVRYTHANTASFFFIFVYAQTQFYLFDYLNNYSCHRPFNNIDLFKQIIDDFLNAIKPKSIKSSAYPTTHQLCEFARTEGWGRENNI